MITTALRFDGPHSYDVHVTPQALIITGPVPIDDFRALTDLAKLKGFDLLDTGLASALDATFVMTNKEHGAALRKEIADGLSTMDPHTAWLLGTDTGISSKTIYAILLDRPSGADLSERGHPHDPDDFGRCYRLLKRFPDWRARIGEMAAVSPEWKALVSCWDELERLYEEELPAGTCPKLYARMKELVG